MKLPVKNNIQVNSYSFIGKGNLDKWLCYKFNSVCCLILKVYLHPILKVRLYITVLPSSENHFNVIAVLCRCYHKFLLGKCFPMGVVVNTSRSDGSDQWEWREIQSPTELGLIALLL